MKNFWTISKSFHRPYNWLYWISWTFPLAWINDLSATESWWTVSLTWTDPDDVVKWWKTVTSWTSTKIVRKEWSAPTDSTDWDLILTETTKNQYSSSWYVDSTIPASWTYYYVAFAVADNWLETISNVEEVAVVVQQYKTYTITREEKSDMSSWRVYSDDATWMTAWSTDFDKFFWYSAVLLAPDWSEVEEVKQSSPWTLNMNSFQWALTWTANNVMIKFPRRWVKMSKDWNFVTLSITNDPDKAWFQYYAFTKWTTAKDYLYLWAYEWTLSNDDSTIATSYSSSDSRLKSRATLTLWTYSPYWEWRIARARGFTAWYSNGYSLMTIYPRRYICCLYMMKYWNPDSQSVVWMWNVSRQWYQAPWWTNSQTSATYWTSSDEAQIKLFWLEDIRWNVYDYADCWYFNSNNELTVDKTNSIFQTSDYATNLWAIWASFMKSIDWSNDWMFMNKSSWSWTNTTYYMDSVSSGGGSSLVRFGGWTRSWLNAWIFFMSSSGPNSSWGAYGMRLQYL